MEAETLPFTESSYRRISEAYESVEQHAVQAKNLIVPTDDKLVKMRLRELHEPICLFAENPGDRRMRLKKYLLDHGIERAMPSGYENLQNKLVGWEAVLAEKKARLYDQLGIDITKQGFLIEGDPALVDARDKMIKYSMVRSDRRLKFLKSAHEYFQTHTQEVLTSDAVVATEAQNLSLIYSQLGDVRPLSSIKFVCGADGVLSGGWSGAVKLWDTSDCSELARYTEHTERVHGLAVLPSLRTGANAALKDLVNSPNKTLGFASCGADNLVKLWAFGQDSRSSLGTLIGHSERVNRVCFHPSGAFLGSTSHDLTWRFWDVESQKCLAVYEGHGRPVYSIDFQGDGSLALTGGLDSYVRVWDVRLGRNVMDLAGHVKGVLTVNVSPDGYHVVSGSEDHSVKIWDLRKKGCLYTLPAHDNIVIMAQFEENDGSMYSSFQGDDDMGDTAGFSMGGNMGGGRVIITSSFDQYIKVWSARDFSLLSVLKAHDQKILAGDVACGVSPLSLATACYDRTWKLWQPEM